jgi:uncharacterized iron-regulated membrane protein
VRGFFRVITDWHRWLGAAAESRDTGRAVTGACNAAFAALIVSGFFLWWPRRWTRFALRAIAVPSLTLQGKPRDWNWHNAIGFWSAPVLLFITLTGLVISYQWAGNLIYTLTGSAPPPPPQRPTASAAVEGAMGRTRAASRVASGMPNGLAMRQPRAEESSDIASQNRTGNANASDSAPVQASLDALFATAREQAPLWRLISLRLPQRGAPHMTVTIAESDSLHPYPRSTLTLDATSGAVVKWEPFASYDLGRTIRSWVRPVHTGEAGGLIGQMIAALASAGGAVLVYTGLALAWRRFWQYVKRHWRRPEQAPEAERNVVQGHEP